jgi:hypothetical protein
MTPEDPLLGSLIQACNEVRLLETKRKDLLTNAVDVPTEAEENEDFVEAINRLSDGRSGFTLPFGKGEARKLVAAVTVWGPAPKTSEDWGFVKAILHWRSKVRQCVAVWRSVAAEFGIETQFGSVESVFKKICQVQTYVDDLRELTFDYDARLHPKLLAVFGHKTADEVLDGGEPLVQTAFGSLQVHVEKGRLAYALNRVGELAHKLANFSGLIVDDLRSFLTEAIGDNKKDEGELHAK